MSRVIEGTIIKSGESCGIQLRLENGTMLTVEDVDPDESVVRAFMQRLIGEWLDEDQLRYLTEDWLEEIYGL